MQVQSLSHVRLFATPWTVAHQAPPSMGFSRQGCWSGLPFPSPGDPPNPGIEPRSPTSQADALPSEPPGKPAEHHQDLQKNSVCPAQPFVVVQSLSHVSLSATPRTAARQVSLSFTISQSLLKLMSIESVMPSNHLTLCCPLLLLPSIFLRIRVFSNDSTLHIRWPKY